MNKPVYREDIDALRGLSVLLVVIFHAFPDLLPGGFIGVDIFFVISGYLITIIIIKEFDQGQFSFLDFYQRRIRRIFPALLTVLLFSIFVGWFILFPAEFEKLGHHILSSVFFLQNFTLIKELGYFDSSSHYKPLLHLWTLSVEEQYYFIWPVIILTILKLKINIFKVISLIILLSFIANLYFVSNYKNEVFFHSLTRFWELGLGSILGIYFFYHNEKTNPFIQKYSRYIFMLGLGLIFITALLINDKTLYPYWYGLIPTCGAILILVANLKLKNWGGLVAVGLISYPLYLWHWVLISFSYIYLGQKPSVTILLVLVSLSFLLSYLTYRYIEKIRYIKSNKVIFLLLFLFLSVGLVGVLIKHYDGLPQRSHLAYLSKYKAIFKRTPATDQSCKDYVLSLVKEKVLFNYCRSSFNKKSAKIIAVIGDSHAHVLFPGIAKKAAQHGYHTILLANSSCPPLLGFFWSKSPEKRENCRLRIKQILMVLKQDTRIEKVIFTTRGPVYIHGEVKGKLTDISVKKSMAIRTKSYKDYANSFGKTLEYLSGIGHIQNIFYYLENPELDFLPKEVIPRPFDYWGISIQNSTIPKKYYRWRMKQYKQNILEKGRLFSKVTIIDVEPYFCPSDKCYSYKNGQFLYVDDDHLSVIGSYYLADKTENIFLDINP